MSPASSDMDSQAIRGPWFSGNRPVLVTGGGGFIGGTLGLRLAALAPPGGEVVLLDNGTRDCLSTLAPTLPSGLRMVKGDIRRPEDWLTDLGPLSVVVHCAALAGVGTYYRCPEKVLEVNGLGTARLLEGLAENPPELFVNLSTSEVYGAQAAGADEAGPTPVGPVSDPRWTYAASKVFAEHLVLATSRSTGLPVVSMRPFNVYGPGQMGEGAVRNFVERAVRGQPLEITGDGSPTRAWLYIEDFVEALLALAATPEAWGRTYNVGSPEALVSTRELAETINRLAGSPAELRFVPHPGQDVLERWPRTEALREATGWVPKVSLEEGLGSTVDFWRKRLS